MRLNSMTIAVFRTTKETRYIPSLDCNKYAQAQNTGDRLVVKFEMRSRN